MKTIIALLLGATGAAAFTTGVKAGTIGMGSFATAKYSTLVKEIVAPAAMTAFPVKQDDAPQRRLDGACPQWCATDSRQWEEKCGWDACLSACTQCAAPDISLTYFAGRSVNCWGACGGKNGDCDACGVGGKCCRIGHEGGGCDGSMGIEDYHTCVAPSDWPSMPDTSFNCWGACGAKNGDCDACGAHGKCCRIGHEGGGCDGSMGIKDYHTCVAGWYGRYSFDCWGICGGKNGDCDTCGARGKCCRIGHEGGGCDGSSMGIRDFHTCVPKKFILAERAECLVREPTPIPRPSTWPNAAPPPKQVQPPVHSSL